jgi:hypothetical protein
MCAYVPPHGTNIKQWNGRTERQSIAQALAYVRATSRFPHRHSDTGDVLTDALVERGLPRRQAEPKAIIDFLLYLYGKRQKI